MFRRYQERHSETLDRLYFGIAQQTRIGDAIPPSSRGGARQGVSDSEAAAPNPDPVWRDLSLKEFGHIRLQYDMDWPLNLIVTPEQMRSYGRVWNLLLQLRLVSQELTTSIALLRAHERLLWRGEHRDLFHRRRRPPRHRLSPTGQDSPDGGGRGERFDSLHPQIHVQQHRMRQFLDALQVFFEEQVLKRSWDEFLSQVGVPNRSLPSAAAGMRIETLADLAAAHDRYVTRILRR